MTYLKGQLVRADAPREIWNKKLIEVALPLPEINDASAYDKMPGIGPHPKGIHHWWARLPLPTARAVLFASVVDDPECSPDRWPTEELQAKERDRLFGVMRGLLQKNAHTHPEVYEAALAEMRRSCGGRLPAFFDPFSGGGSIPLEAHRLGFDVSAGDLNPVAVLLNKCNLELAPRWSGRPPINVDDRARLADGEGWSGTNGLAADIRYYAAAVRSDLENRLGTLYPKVQLRSETGAEELDVIAWIWARTVASPNPAVHGRHVPLVSSFVLSSKGENATYVRMVQDSNSKDGWYFEVRDDALSKDDISRAKLGTKAGKGQDFICSLSSDSTPIKRSYVQAEGKAGRLGLRLMAVVAHGPRGRVYLTPDQHQESVAKSAGADKKVAETRNSLLYGALPTRAEITGGVCTAYGLSTWGHLFVDRQVMALLTLSDAIVDIRSRIVRDAFEAGLSRAEAGDYAATLTTFLALAADRTADFNNSLCRWSSSNQKVMNLFGKQAIPMVFDFAEANVLGESVGAWLTCSNYVADCVRVIGGGGNGSANVFQFDAAANDYGQDGLVISTDPPYYNNISYAVLSDFFYVWLRRSVGQLHPGLFDTVLTPKVPELIAAPNRFSNDEHAAKRHFEDGFRHAFTSLNKRMDRRFPLTVYYAFRQDDEVENPNGRDGAVVDATTGWETLLEALISSGFQITATWPVRASQKWRQVSMGKNALASYIVLACRPRPAEAPSTDRRSFISELRRVFPSALTHLQQGNVAPVDLAQAALGPGMAIYSRYSQVLDATGKALTVRAALKIINQMIDEISAEQQGDLDVESRWAISWFEENGFEPGDYGVAETLSKAKNTSIAALTQRGVLDSRGGKVRLLKPAELSNDAKSATEQWMAWEIVHHCIRVLQTDGEGAVADLMVKIGPSAEVARELAYRLFTISERAKRSPEAVSYNSLVQSWPEIVRLTHGQSGSAQQDLFGDQ